LSELLSDASTGCVKSEGTKKEKGGKQGKRPPGRPSSYRKEYAAQAVKLCRLGATDKELADFFGVSVATLNTWKKEHPEFLESLKEGKDSADAQVADSLFRRATGYSHEDMKFATFEGKITDTKKFTKHHPPDTVACIFWLKNRRPDLWREKIGLEHSGPDGGPIKNEGEYRPSEEDEAVLKRIAEARAKIQEQKPESGEGA